MNTMHSVSESTGRMAEQAAQSTDHAIRSTQRVANEALDRLSDVVQQAPTALQTGAARAEEMARRGVAAVRERAVATTDHARSMVEHDPMKSVVLAAALGAGLTALWMWLSHRSTYR